MRKITRIALAFALSVAMVLPGSTVFGAQASAEPEYQFKKTESAENQLQDLFTTIDIMDATIDGLE
jgi:peptidoglycan hydrolase CwlO-like protein